MINLLSNLFDNFMFLILYVSNGASFPKPLSPNEEKYYIEKYLAGDKDARDVLIERNLRLVAHVIKKYYSSDNNQEDLISIGTIGLIKGISSFKPCKGTKLATYAARCIENEILMFFRAQRKNMSESFINDAIDIDEDGNSLTYLDVVYQDDDIADSIDLKMNTDKLYSFISDLSEREKTILTMRYGLYNTKTYTQKEVARLLGISRSYVSRIEKKAILSLKSKFEGKSDFK